MLKKSLFTLITRGINSSGSVLLSIVLAINFSAVGVGSYMMSIAVLLGSSMLARYGTDLYLLKNCSIHYIDKDYVAFKTAIISSVKFVSLSSVLLSLFSLILSFYIIYNLDNLALGLLLAIFSLAIPILSLLTQISTIFKSILKPQLSPFFEFNFASFLLSIILIMFLYFNCELSITYVAVMHFIIIFILLLIGVMTINLIDNNLFKVKLLNSVAIMKPNKELTDMFLPNFMHYIIQWGTLLIIGFLVTESDVGIYSIAHRFSFLVNFILIVLNSVTAPYFASYYKAGKMQELELLAIRSTKIMMLLGFPVFLGLLLFTEELFLLLGEDFKQSTAILGVLIFGQLINISTGSVAFLLNMTGKQKEMRNIMLLTASVTVISCVILTSIFGIIGTAISTTLGLILQNVLATWKVYKILNIKSIPGWKWISEPQARNIN